MTANRNVPLYTMAALLAIHTFAAIWTGVDSPWFVALVATGFLLLAAIGLRIEQAVKEGRSGGD